MQQYISLDDLKEYKGEISLYSLNKCDGLGINVNTTLGKIFENNIVNYYDSLAKESNEGLIIIDADDFNPSKIFGLTKKYENPIVIFISNPSKIEKLKNLLLRDILIINKNNIGIINIEENIKKNKELKEQLEKEKALKELENNSIDEQENINKVKQIEENKKDNLKEVKKEVEEIIANEKENLEIIETTDKFILENEDKISFKNDDFIEIDEDLPEKHTRRERKTRKENLNKDNDFKDEKQEEVLEETLEEKFKRERLEREQRKQEERERRKQERLNNLKGINDKEDNNEIKEINIETKNITDINEKINNDRLIIKNVGSFGLGQDLEEVFSEFLPNITKLKITENKKFDLYIFDISYASDRVFNYLNEELQTSPIILISVYPEKVKKYKYIDIANVLFLSKPFNKENKEIEKIVVDYLHNYNRNDEIDKISKFNAKQPKMPNLKDSVEQNDIRNKYNARGNSSPETIKNTKREINSNNRREDANVSLASIYEKLGLAKIAIFESRLNQELFSTFDGMVIKYEPRGYLIEVRLERLKKKELSANEINAAMERLEELDINFAKKQLKKIDDRRYQEFKNSK